MTLDELFGGMVIPEPNSGCWLWLGSTVNGYGKTPRYKRVHRYAYEMIKGPVPEGLELDHLCRVRCCVNPDHLEPVTRRENIRRGEAAQRTFEHHNAKTHCSRGHEYTPENTYFYGKYGHCRDCRECRKLNKRAIQRAAQREGRV